MVGSDVADDAALDHRNGFPAVPDVFADQGAGGLVVVGDAAALGIEHRMDGHCCRRGQGADRLTAKRVVFV